MRFSVISVFPQFFDVARLSLLGKAQDRGLISVEVVNLRDFTHDVHRTVDDSPFGGGAGMVMKPDVWAEAIDAQLSAPDSSGETGEPAHLEHGSSDSPHPSHAIGQSDTPGTAQNATHTVLAIPTPSGIPLTQEMCARLAQAKHIVIACGRYEGIDARVAQYYESRSGVEVLEYSLGDYVLNGGEVAAMALMEAVGRLVPGMVGNPDSLVEESYSGAGLLEYPIYTRPSVFRGIEVPRVLTSGDHGKVARWRKARALAKTAERRPDLISALRPTQLDKADRAQLAQLGWLVNDDAEHIQQIRIRLAGPEDVPALAELAARTFPDACPPELQPQAIAEFIDQELSPTQFSHYIASDEYLVLLAEVGGMLAGYVLCVIPQGNGAADEAHGAPTDAVINGTKRNGPLYYLSKFYIDRTWRGSGLFDYMMNQTLQYLGELSRSLGYPQPYVWLGTNEANRRARRAYQRHGFVVVGQRTFYVGDEINTDPVMARPVFMAQ
ncbi:MAG: tRNA (guanosine(37)-N1)-methyltransferase TrmD [Actinomycetaceae bacterium]|nr:tRNA (guanosine(37)-N1)-methyltransferase TrmD [Arcanobacterium sp.]MDD7505817.1 tRNA (guanosine(37)-N1)-methyltransferase TrmD [Actinomycetaceae bacterium]MDY6142872.1 tRNA (guanosine(37)-N1)-methyltransferase TrmD [Arcanobacterium sp.]